MVGLKLYRNSGDILSLKKAVDKKARNISEKDLSIIKKKVIATYNGKIVFLGNDDKNLQKFIKNFAKPVAKELNLLGADVLPGFVEPHSHLVFAGDRSIEFERRIQGESYQQIASKGGGILTTVDAVRKTSQQELLKLAQSRVNNFKKQGVVALEVKSGYGLNFNNEKKMLEVIRRLRRMKIKSTYLGLHSIPKKFLMNVDAFVDRVVHSDLPKLKKLGLLDRVDIFIEKNYFNTKHGIKLFEKAQELNLEITAHVDQLSRQGGALTALKYNASSIDHAVELTQSDIKKIAHSDLTVCLLPMADFYLKTPYPKARSLIQQGARVALATDFNPGSSPSQDLSLVGFLARNEMKMTLAEVLVAYTLGAAYALNWQNDFGSIEVGKSSHLVVLKDNWRKLFYSVGYHPIAKMIN